MWKFSVMKDAFWQILGRMISALSGFLIVIIMTPLLGPLRYGDYTTILSYFALWSALSDLGLYVIGLKDLGKLKAKFGINTPKDLDTITPSQKEDFSLAISQFVWARIGQIVIVYGIAILVAYLVPSYASNPYIARWLPLGMLFSAWFMIAGIIQLPLQLFWKMEQVSIALVLARVAQLAVLWIVVVWNFWPHIDHDAVPLTLFLVMVGSVVISSLTQTLYTLWQSSRIIKIRFVPFWDHMISHIKENGKYGAAFFLSSFHLLIVSLLISIVYPTISGFTYVGIRWLGLQLIQILLIIPAALANSLIHKISALSPQWQKRSFWHLMNLLILFGRICIANFVVFATPIIQIVSGKKYLTPVSGFNLQGMIEFLHLNNWSALGTDFLLPGLAIVLALSFIKTVFNYVFVAANRQNLLFPINLFGVVVWSIIAFWAVKSYNLIGWLIAQFIMEFLFVVGSVYYARKHNIMPKIFYSSHWKMHIFFIVIIGLLLVSPWFVLLNFWQFIAMFAVFNVVIIALWVRFIMQEFGHITHHMNNTSIEESSIL